MRQSYVIIIVLIVLSLLLGAYLYPQMPERMASHWDAQGQVDGYAPKFWGLFVLPLISLLLLLFFVAIPRIDPLKANIEKFRRYYDGFIVLCTIFFLYLHVLTILVNLGLTFEMNQALALAMGLLFFAAGVMMENAKRNWFIGIRTPWTLSNDAVWEKTHRLGGRLFRFAGLVACLGILLPKYALLFIMGPVLLVSAYATVYSYQEFHRVTRAS